jgi:NADPH:quinone reductase-like Zn-dependent oxidoreductase
VLIVHGDSDRLVPPPNATELARLLPGATVTVISTSQQNNTRPRRKATMRAFVVSKYKEPLQEADVPEPVVGEHDVLVQVHAAGLNVVDEKIRAGAFKSFLRYELPQVMGSDVAGTVIGVGAKVWAFALGDHVYAQPRTDRIGSFAERIAVAEADVALKPATVTLEEAGSLPLVALTAWQALVEKGNVRPGQRVLIHAGAGGVGTIAIQLAKHLGATVATTVSAGNVDFVRELGADSVIDYRNQAFEQLLDGDDLVLDSVGGENLEKSLRVLRPGGKAIGIVGPPDAAFAREAGLNPVLRLAIAALSWKIRRQARKLGVTYEFLFMRASGDQLREIAALVDSGVLRPVVGRVFDFDQTVEAMQPIGKGGIHGKAVITGV